MDFQLLLSRVLRALLLDGNTFEEIRTNDAETLSAILVILVASYAAGLGGFIWTYTAAQYVDHLRFFIRSFLVGSALQVAIFFIWVAITLLVLERVYRVPARYTELMRVMAFASIPLALQLLIFVPAIDQPLGIIALAATLSISTYAIQISTVATPAQAFTANLLGFAVFCLILGILGNGWSDLAPGLFALDPNSLSVGLTLPLSPPFR